MKGLNMSLHNERLSHFVSKVVTATIEAETKE